VKVGKSATKILEMLPEALGEHFLSWTVVFEWHSCFKAGEMSVGTFRATKYQQNNRTCWKNSRTRPQRPSLNNPWACRHCWDQLWRLPWDPNRKFEHAPHCHEVCSPTLDKCSKAATREGWREPNFYLYFALFSKLKIKLKGRCFETVSDIQRKPHAVLNSIKENDFHCAFEVWNKQTMGSPYTFPRRLFWRRWQPNMSKTQQSRYLVRNYFLMCKYCTCLYFHNMFQSCAIFTHKKIVANEVTWLSCFIVYRRNRMHSTTI
jgi:hypothetical protein